MKRKRRREDGEPPSKEKSRKTDRGGEGQSASGELPAAKIGKLQVEHCKDNGNKGTEHSKTGKLKVPRLADTKRKRKRGKEKEHQKKAQRVKLNDGRPEPSRGQQSGPTLAKSQEEYNPFSRVKQHEIAEGDTPLTNDPASVPVVSANDRVVEGPQRDAPALSSATVPSHKRTETGSLGGPSSSGVDIIAIGNRNASEGGKKAEGSSIALRRPSGNGAGTASARHPAAKALPASVKSAVNSNWLKLKATLVPAKRQGGWRKRGVKETEVNGVGSSAVPRKEEAGAKAAEMNSTQARGAAAAAQGRPTSALLPANTGPGVGNGNLTKVVALDCEMVGIGEGGRRSAPAHVCIVNSHGLVVYEKHVRVLEKVTDFKTYVSGVRPRDLRKGHAEDFEIVRKEVADLLKGRVLVGHSLRNDLKALMLGHPMRLIRDTQKFHRFRGRMGQKRSLKSLAEEHLNMRIQAGEHNPAEDARAALYLYLKYRKEWEQSLLAQKTGVSAVDGISAKRSRKMKKTGTDDIIGRTLAKSKSFGKSRSHDKAGK
ncbi:hypothetical protein CBR_g37123 [Chara braunii]|uniref:RNA exonuclease 4 n=1 Tax=Chara braunii TaxID=69332 RepID=A0A388LM57_CHABU|nr:hypothetical protein CBR_g37123 [Chara braunii]|eukprot:GBG83409.1 hypothetical protein CBR_g37123 [Chara braunii]